MAEFYACLFISKLHRVNLGFTPNLSVCLGPCVCFFGSKPHEHSGTYFPVRMHKIRLYNFACLKEKRTTYIIQWLINCYCLLYWLLLDNVMRCSLVNYSWCCLSFPPPHPPSARWIIQLFGTRASFSHTSLNLLFQKLKERSLGAKKNKECSLRNS